MANAQQYQALAAQRAGLVARICRSTGRKAASQDEMALAIIVLFGREAYAAAQPAPVAAPVVVAEAPVAKTRLRKRTM